MKKISLLKEADKLLSNPDISESDKVIIRALNNTYLEVCKKYFN